MFSDRTAIPRDPNALAVALADARRAGRTLLDLTLSNPTEAGLPYPAEAIAEALAAAAARPYEPAPFGLEPARAAVSREMGVDPSRIVLTASTSEAYAYAFALLCDPGDEVLVPQPSYPLLDLIARFESVRLVPYRLAYDGRWHVDLGSVRRAVGERTRAIVTVSPNNPTGSFLGRDELAALAELALPIVSDEVFRRYPIGQDPRRAQTALEARGAPLVVALGGLSKLAGLPQMKLAWMALGGEDDAVAEALARLELVADAYLSPSGPVQHAAPRLLELGGQVREAIRKRVQRNLERLQRATAETAITLLRVEGGWYAVLRLPRTHDEQQWCLALLEQDVLVQPGWLYDFPEQAYVVSSLLPSPAVFDAGIERLAATVARMT